jgi:hypothetical protein
VLSGFLLAPGSGKFSLLFSQSSRKKRQQMGSNVFAVVVFFVMMQAHFFLLFWCVSISCFIAGFYVSFLKR